MEKDIEMHIIQNLAMSHKPSNQRTERSKNVMEALSLQLQAAARRARFDSIVLADDLGLVLAEAGNSKRNEELAALSPVLAPELVSWRGQVKTRQGKVRVSIAPMRIGDSRMFLTATGGDAKAVSRELFKSGLGVARILG
ncbi:MAG: hypothetical protein GY762_04880 [Proteobacteria bacterium]|nr:hypothetical protein [Pseudomonadota bacterium]